MKENVIQTKSIPKTRISRLTHLGALVGKVAGNVAIESSKQWLSGQKVASKDLILSQSNIEHLTHHLVQMRGAAMKLGQLLSMDAGDLLPEELTAILSRLRANGTSMPLPALNKRLEEDWGQDWSSQFVHFSFHPIAAASIGQVHRAKTQDGRVLALKIQYPGIRQSIDSDVDNLASLIKLSRLIPKSVDLKPLLNETKEQLHDEANYQLESEHLLTYRRYLADDKRFLIPNIDPNLTTENILAMEFVSGEPIESLVVQSQAVRNQVMSALFELMFRELFEFQLVQTDPNFANYLYNSETGQIVLLDFGATRTYSSRISDGYQELMQAAIKQDRAKLAQAAELIGFFQDKILPSQKEAVLALFEQACEPLYENKAFDFGATDLAQRIKDKGMALSLELNYWHTPPADAIFFHRKLGGLYLLAAKLKAQVNLHQLFSQCLHEA